MKILSILKNNLRNLFSFIFSVIIFSVFTINVNAVVPTPDSIEIVSQPNKITYFVGDVIDLTGLVVNAKYPDGFGGFYSNPITNYVVTGFDSSSPVKGQILTITEDVGNKTTNFSVDILAQVISENTTNSTSGSGSSGNRRRSVNTTPAPTPVVTNTNPGQVLGESTFAFNNNLLLGMQSEEVRELQERLRAEGFFTFHTSTGYFGPITLAAVKAYQQAKGIPFITGFVGPLTRAELNK